MAEASGVQFAVGMHDRDLAIEGLDSSHFDGYRHWMNLVQLDSHGESCTVQFVSEGIMRSIGVVGCLNIERMTRTCTLVSTVAAALRRSVRGDEHQSFIGAFLILLSKGRRLRNMRHSTSLKITIAIAFKLRDLLLKNTKCGRIVAISD